MSTEEEFFAGFDPPTLKIDPIGPQAELKARIRDLEAQLCQEREAHQQTVQDRNMLAARIIYGEVQVAQLQTTVGQLRSALGKFMGLKRHKIWNGKNYTHFNMLNSDLQAIDELWASLIPEASQEKPQP